MAESKAAPVQARAVGNAVFLDAPGGSPGEFGAWGMPGADGAAVVAGYVNDAFAPLAAERDRLREAVTWAVGFIRCNLPNTAAEYPDMRNALALVDETKPLMHGEFQMQVSRAEVAEYERDRLRDEVTTVLGQLDGLAEVWGDEGQFRRVRDRLRAAVEEANAE